MNDQLTPQEQERVHEAFERYDRLLEFEKRLANLINSSSIDDLLGVPDYVLAASARLHLEHLSNLLKCAKIH